VVGMASGKWMVLDSQTREVYGVFQDGHEALQAVRFSPNGKFLALGSRDNIIYIYQVADGGKKFSRMGRCMVSIRGEPHSAFGSRQTHRR
jgi:microtubule-associated protein-like 1/2